MLYTVHLDVMLIKFFFHFNLLLTEFRAKPVYMTGQLVYCVGMIMMAATRHKVGVIIFSLTAGIMYSTLFTMPYLLVAHYHSSQVVCDSIIN